MGIEIKKMDRHGRIVIPKKWREKIGGGNSGYV